MYALVNLKMKTKYHEKAWKSYEKIMMYRSNAGLFCVLLIHIILSIYDKEMHKISRRMMDSDDPPIHFNRDIAEAIYPVVDNTFTIYMAVQTLLLIISYKRPSVCKYYFYIELMEDFLIRLLPHSQDWDM